MFDVIFELMKLNCNVDLDFDQIQVQMDLTCRSYSLIDVKECNAITKKPYKGNSFFIMQESLCLDPPWNI